jgi:hypothetical protein
MRESVPLPWWQAPFGRQLVRRVLVVVLVPICLLLILVQDAGTGVLLVLLLLADNLVLRRATQRLAVAPEAALDEREVAVRNRAYRLAYRLLAVAFGIPLWLLFLTAASDPSWILDDVSNGGLVITSLELLFFLPTAIIAWIEPDMPEAEPIEWHLTGQQKVAASLLLTLIFVPVLWSIGVAFAGHSSSYRHVDFRNVPFGPGKRLASCEYFGATKQVRAGIGAQIRLSADLCWNGKQVWQEWGLNRSDCQPSSEVLVVASMTCTTRFGHDGTIHVLYRADAHAALLPFIQRHVTIGLVIRPDGHVIRFP